MSSNIPMTMSGDTATRPQINDGPDYGFNVLKLEKQGILPAAGRALKKLMAGPYELVKVPVRWLVRNWPWGNLCDFHLEGQGRIRLTKNLWVIVGGDTRNDSTDALPLSFVSPHLIDRIAKELNGKWYMPLKLSKN